MGPENRRVLTSDSSDPFSVFWSRDGCGGVDGRWGGDDGRTEPDLCGLGSATLGDRTGDLWTTSAMEDGGGRGGGLLAIVVVGGMAISLVSLGRRGRGVR